MSLMLIQVFHAFHAAHHQPDYPENQNKQPDSHYPEKEAEQHHYKTNPEGTDLELVMGLQPLRCVTPVHVSDDDTDDAEKLNDDVDHHQQVHDLGGRLTTLFLGFHPFILYKSCKQQLI